MRKHLDEFTASLLSYVRMDTGTGDRIDVRDELARKWSAILAHDPSPPFLNLFASFHDCHDCAAIFSGCVGIKYPVSVLRTERTNRLPLMARPNHPAEQFLDTLLKTDIGRELYRSMALLFSEAQSIPELQDFLFHPAKCDRETAPVTPTIDEVNDPPVTDERVDDGDPEEDISEENCAATVRHLESTEAGSALRDAAQGDAHTCLAIAENPGVALAALQRDDAALGLNTRDAAKALEKILGTFVSPLDARAMMDAYLTPERQAKLLGALDDLDSVAAITVGQDTLRLMLLYALASPVTAVSPYKPDPREITDHSASRQNVNLYRIATVIKDNPCYEQLLNVDLDGLTFRERLLVAAWVLAKQPKFIDDITPDFFDNVGLDRDLDGDASFQMFLDDRRADLEIDSDNLADQIAQIVKGSAGSSTA